MSPPRPGSLRARPFAAATLAGGFVIALALAGTLDSLERSEYDLLFRLRGARAPVAPVVIAAIDEASFEALGRWPFPRAVHARAIDRLREAGAAVIAIDILFPEPSPPGPEDNDRLLGEAVARAGNVVLAMAVTQVSDGAFTKIDLNPPVAAIRAGAAAMAPVNAVVDADGVLRRVSLSAASGDQPLPNFVVEIHRLTTSAGIAAAPLPAVDTLLIDFRGGPGAFPRLPYHRIVAGQFERKSVADKVVLVGVTDPAVSDVFSTAIDGRLAMPGVEVQANALENLLAGTRIRVLPRPLLIVVLLLAAMATGGMVAWAHDHALLVALATVVALAVADVALFSTLRWWPQSGLVILALAAACLAAVVADSPGRPRTARKG
ncbi:MAG: CHASE2 domain-containing protein [Candidatus Rokuibacteriota bacterium]